MDIQKKIVYIVGCGRSGSTIVGFCLGNCNGVLDLGEVLDFAAREGAPNGFDTGSANFEYWRSIKERLEQGPEWIGFKKFRKYERRFDSHLGLIAVATVPWLLLPFGLRDYRATLKRLYTIILESTNHSCYVDGSKYPSRLVHLNVLFPSQVHALHIVRDPAALYVALSGDQQSRPRTFWQAMSYFFAVNCATKYILAVHHRGKSIAIDYECLVASPIKTLRRINEAFEIDTRHAEEIISNKLPLSRGFIFNGNRMRVQEAVVFQAGVRRNWPDSIGKRMPIRILRRLFCGHSAINPVES